MWSDVRDATFAGESRGMARMQTDKIVGVRAFGDESGGGHFPDVNTSPRAVLG